VNPADEAILFCGLMVVGRILSVTAGMIYWRISTQTKLYVQQIGKQPVNILSI
jgi:hypothetical protein